MAQILRVVGKLLDLGPSYHTVLAEWSMGAMQYDLTSSCPCTPSLKSPSDSPIPSVRTPCYFYISGVLLCPVTLNTPDQQQAFPWVQGMVSTMLGHTRGHSTEKLSSPASTDYFSALFMDIFSSNLRSISRKQVKEVPIFL